MYWESYDDDDTFPGDKFAEVQFGGPSEATGGKKDLSQMIFDSIVEKVNRNFHNYFLL